MCECQFGEGDGGGGGGNETETTPKKEWKVTAITSVSEEDNDGDQCVLDTDKICLTNGKVLVSASVKGALPPKCEVKIIDDDGNVVGSGDRSAFAIVEDNKNKTLRAVSCCGSEKIDISKDECGDGGGGGCRCELTVGTKKKQKKKKQPFLVTYDLSKNGEDCKGEKCEIEFSSPDNVKLKPNSVTLANGRGSGRITAIPKEKGTIKITADGTDCNCGKSSIEVDISGGETEGCEVDLIANKDEVCPGEKVTFAAGFSSGGESHDCEKFVLKINDIERHTFKELPGTVELRVQGSFFDGLGKEKRVTNVKLEPIGCDCKTQNLEISSECKVQLETNKDSVCESKTFKVTASYQGPCCKGQNQFEFDVGAQGEIISKTNNTATVKAKVGGGDDPIEVTARANSEVSSSCSVLGCQSGKVEVRQSECDVQIVYEGSKEVCAGQPVEFGSKFACDGEELNIDGTCSGLNWSSAGGSFKNENEDGFGTGREVTFIPDPVFIGDELKTEVEIELDSISSQTCSCGDDKIKMTVLRAPKLDVRADSVICADEKGTLEIKNGLPNCKVKIKAGENGFALEFPEIDADGVVRLDENGEFSTTFEWSGLGGLGSIPIKVIPQCKTDKGCSLSSSSTDTTVIEIDEFRVKEDEKMRRAEQCGSGSTLVGREDLVIKTKPINVPEMVDIKPELPKRFSFDTYGAWMISLTAECGSIRTAYLRFLIPKCVGSGDQTIAACAGCVICGGVALGCGYACAQLAPPLIPSCVAACLGPVSEECVTSCIDCARGL